MSRADWQLPAGVDRGLWEYLTDAELAQTYDASLSESALPILDAEFAQRWFTKPGSLIDLGCGTGRLLVPFAKRGFTVVGVDLSEAMLKVAHHNASLAGLPMTLLKANLVELDAFRDEVFDHAACLFSTLGMIRGKNQRYQMLRHVHRIMKPGGIFIVHAHNRRFGWYRHFGIRWLLDDVKRAIFGGPEVGDRTMPQHLRASPMTLHHFSKPEIIQTLHEVGFTPREIISVGAGPTQKISWCSNLRAYGWLIAAERNDAPLPITTNT
jgi:ubiquinone/menaquinone biosynthesis C-methylase UbiE